MGQLRFYDKSTCGTCKKAKAFLEAEGVGYERIDIEKNPPSEEILNRLVDENDVKASLNIRSTIYKQDLRTEQLSQVRSAVGATI